MKKLRGPHRHANGYLLYVPWAMTIVDIVKKDVLQQFLVGISPMCDLHSTHTFPVQCARCDPHI